jgi:DNA-binding IclR family transcriptional regulator
LIFYKGPPGETPFHGCFCFFDWQAFKQKKVKKMPSTVNSVRKALRLLECFTPQRGDLSLTQLSQMLGIPKSTLLNLIKTLEDAGYLYKQKNSQNYHLGFKLMELGYNVRSALPLVQLVLPVMEELQIATGEIVYLTSHIGGRVLYLECVYPSKRSISYSVFGKTLPMHCTGCGKAMLAYMSDSMVDDIIARWGMPRFTINTITEPAKLKSALARYRELGYALDNEEETHNVKCVAMPVRNQEGNVAGALSISGPVLSMTDERIELFTNFLAKSCGILVQYAHLFPAIQLLKAPN